jgi:hypothetical protein
MVGITLSPEQIRHAPAEVRRWLRGEIATSLDVDSDVVASSGLRNLSVCSIEEAGAIYEKIRGIFPAVNMFFELGRDGELVTSEGLVAHRLVDMLQHTRLQTIQQLSACLQIINQAARELGNNPEISLYVIDQHGYCFVSADTQRSIAALWRQLMSGPDERGAARPGSGDPRQQSTSFPSLHGALAAGSTHMGDFAVPEVQPLPVEGSEKTAVRGS